MQAGREAPHGEPRRERAHGGADGLGVRRFGKPQLQLPPDREGQVDPRQLAHARAHGTGGFAVDRPQCRPHAVNERPRPPFARDPALLQRADAVAALRLLHVGRRDHDRHAVRAHAFEQLPEGAARQGIDARGGLVEEHDARPAHERAGQRELLHHPARQLRRAAILESRQSGALEQIGDHIGSRRAGQPVQRRKEAQVLKHGQVEVLPERLRHVCDGLAHSRIFGRDAEHADVPRGRRQLGDQQLQQGALAGAVGAHDTEDLACLHRQVQAGEHHAGAAREVQVAGTDRRGRVGPGHGQRSAPRRVTSAGMPILSSPALSSMSTVTR